MAATCMATFGVFGTAQAELGGRLGSSMAAESNANLHIAAMSRNPGVTILTAIANGITVKQYAAPDGRIFAVSWSGPAKPDLQALLGAAFPAINQPDKKLSSLGLGVVRQADLVIESYGRLRDFHGDAYIPSLTPQGFAF
jgi:hypothetical protein